MSKYDLIMPAYLGERPRLKSDKYVRKLLKLLPKRATILDVGCGAGWPVDNLLTQAGHEVVGVDSARAMIAEARRRVPEASYIVKKIEDLQAGEYRVEAVVSFYALFHTPRGKHGEILKKLVGCLTPKGYLLITMGDREWEGWHELYGQKVWSSQWGTKKNRELVEQAGAKIIFDELATSGGERHQVILAQKMI